VVLAPRLPVRLVGVTDSVKFAPVIGVAVGVAGGVAVRVAV